MKRLAMLCLLCSGCATTYTKIDSTETFPGYSMRTYVFGSAKMAESAQKFNGQLTVVYPDGRSVTVALDNGQNAKGLEAAGIEAVARSLADAVVKGLIPLL